MNVNGQKRCEVLRTLAKALKATKAPTLSKHHKVSKNMYENSKC